MNDSRGYVIFFWIASAACAAYGAAWMQGRAVAASSAPGMPLSGYVHLQDLGDVPLRDGVWAGTKGQSRRLEGFSLQFAVPVAGLGLAYMCHLQDMGDTSWLPAGSYCGTRGQSRRLEGFAIRLGGANASKYDVLYMCHLQDIGDVGPVKNGDFCGTRGESRRVEAIIVWVKPKPQ